MYQDFLDNFRKNKPIGLQPVTGVKDYNPRTGLPYYLDYLKYGELRERYRDYDKPTVCVIDNGVNPLAPDIGKNIVEYLDFTGEGIKYQGDHGIHVSSIVSGESYGISDNVPIAHYKALTYKGSGTMLSLRKALRAAVNRKFEVISLSLGSNYPDKAIENLLRQATKDKKTFIIVAAGNGGDSDATDYPAAYSETIPAGISVAAGDIRKDGTKKFASFSSVGSNTITAQGVDVLSAGVFHKGKQKYRFMSGTSQATPQVAAIIAIAKGIYPNFELKHFWEAAECSCVDILEDGNDKSSGVGFVNPELFLKYVEDIASKENDTEVTVKRITFWEWLKLLF